MSGRYKSLATVDYTEEENDDGRDQECVFVTCNETDQTVGPIWGQSEASVKRALATLTEECDCEAGFHEVES